MTMWALVWAFFSRLTDFLIVNWNIKVDDSATKQKNKTQNDFQLQKHVLTWPNEWR